MEISIEQFEQLNPEEYRLYDIRSLQAREYGSIAGSFSIDAEQLLQDENLDRDKMLIVYDNRGIESLTVSDRLSEKGYRSCSLQGGYIGYMGYQMHKPVDDSFCDRVEQSLRKKFRPKLWGKFIKAIKEYQLLQPGDCVAVCISGGKDSMLLAKLFQELLRHSDFEFTVKYLVMDPGYNKENRWIIEENARRLKIPVQIFETDIFESVYSIGDKPCYMCARMRRGYLYRFAKEMGCNKIALGHHYDDVIETILMSMLYGGQIQSMMPKLRSDNFEGMQLIRPLYLIRESDIKAWRDYNGLYFIQCACRFTDQLAEDGSDEHISTRWNIKQLIRKLKKSNPDVEKCIFSSVENVNIDQIIAYKKSHVRHSFLEDYDKEN